MTSHFIFLVSKEREKRVSLERKHESLVRKSRHTTQLYEASLVQLAKEVRNLPCSCVVQIIVVDSNDVMLRFAFPLQLFYFDMYS